MHLTKDFQQILIDIFTKYDEKNLKTVPDIIKRFRHNKEQVILHLCNKYEIDIHQLEGVDMSGEVAAAATATSGAEGEDGAGIDAEIEGEKSVEEAPKKKSKLMKIIILIVVLGGLGAGGYFGYDFYMKSQGADGHTEEGAHEDGTHEAGAHEEGAHEEGATEDGAAEDGTEPEAEDPAMSDTTDTDDSDHGGDTGDDPEIH